MNKKILCFVLCVVFSLSFVSCNEDGTSSLENKDNGTIKSFFDETTTLSDSEQLKEDVKNCITFYINAYYQDMSARAIATSSSIYLRSQMYDLFEKNEKLADFDLNFELDDTEKYITALETYIELVKANGYTPYKISGITVKDINAYKTSDEKFKKYLRVFNKKEKAKNVEMFADATVSFDCENTTVATSDTSVTSSSTQKSTETVTQRNVSGNVICVKVSGQWYIFKKIED